MRFSYYFKQGNWFILAIFYVLVFLLIIILIQQQYNNALISYSLLIPAIFFIIFSLYVFIRWHRLDKGLDGENAARKILMDLPSQFTFIPDVVFKGNRWNIDFILIGPDGIWAIEVKNRNVNAILKGYYLSKDSKRIKSNSLEIHNHIQQTLGLDLFIQPVLVHANKKTQINFGWEKQDNVYVIGINFLPQLISHPPRTPLSQEQCQAIYSELKKFTSVI